MKYPQNLRVFHVKYLPYTDKSPARIRIKDHRHDKSVVISHYHEVFDQTLDVARDYLSTRGIEPEFMAEMEDGYLLLTTDFKTQIK